MCLEALPLQGRRGARRRRGRGQPCAPGSPAGPFFPETCSKVHLVKTSSPLRALGSSLRNTMETGTFWFLVFF